MATAQQRAHVATIAAWVLAGLASILVLKEVAAAYSGWRENRLVDWQKSLVPDELGPTRVLHANTSDWGTALGPGGNEAGFIAYELSTFASNEISDKGLEFFGAVESKPYSGLGLEWRSTPIDSDDGQFICPQNWKDPPNDKRKCKSILEFAQRYSRLNEENLHTTRQFGAAADSALFSPGAYFAYTRLGILVVAPDIDRVFYAWRG